MGFHKSFSRVPGAGVTLQLSFQALTPLQVLQCPASHCENSWEKEHRTKALWPCLEHC